MACVDCARDADMNAVLATEVKEKAKNERVILHDLASERFRPMVSIASVEDTNKILFIVPATFLSVWRAHVNRPTTINRPQSLDTDVGDGCIRK